MAKKYADQKIFDAWVVGVEIMVNRGLLNIVNGTPNNFSTYTYTDFNKLIWNGYSEFLIDDGIREDILKAIKVLRVHSLIWTKDIVDADILLKIEALEYLLNDIKKYETNGTKRPLIKRILGGIRFMENKQNLHRVQIFEERLIRFKKNLNW